MIFICIKTAFLLWLVSCKLFHVLIGHLYIPDLLTLQGCCLLFYWVVYLYYWFARVIYIFWIQGFCKVYALIIFSSILIGKSFKFWWNWINQFSLSIALRGPQLYLRGSPSRLLICSCSELCPVTRWKLAFMLHLTSWMPLAMDWIGPPKIPVEALTLDVTIFGDGD